jgi:hypothetical protein
LILGLALLLAVAAFEVEMRMVGWQERARPSRYWTEGSRNDLVDLSLALHLCFAIPTPVLWAVVVLAGLRWFPKPPRPGAHSHFHRFWGQCAAWALVATAVTGWWFYWCAFVA